MEQLANNASTTLNGSINNSVTSVVVADGSVFPSSGNYRVAIDGELLLVTSRTSNTLTVTRGIESTTAAAHANGSLINLLYTKGSFEQIIADYQLVGNWNARPSTVRKGTFYTANDLPARWCYNGAAWDLVWPVCVPSTRVWTGTGWTAMNQGTGVFLNRNGILDIMPNSTGDFLRGFSKAMLTPPFALNWIIGPIPYMNQTTAFAGGFRDSVSGRAKTTFVSGMNGGIRGVEDWYSVNSFAGNESGTFYSTANGVSWVRVEDDGTNWRFFGSLDGKHYTCFRKVARNTFLTNPADQIIFGCDTSFSLNPSATGNANVTIYAYWEE